MAPSDTMNRSEVLETARPTQPASPPVRARPRLFGQFLLDAGAIRDTDVAEALELMRLVNSPVGEIAIGEGLLSAGQVEAILDAQRHVDEHFFELAASMGLGGRDLESLCSEQSVENLRFGDALVEVGAISSTALEDLLRAYDAQDHFPSPCVRGLGSDLADVVADVLPRLARRSLRSSVRFGAPRPWHGEALQIHATAKTRRGGGLLVGLSVEASVTDRIGPREQRLATSWAHQLAPLLLADFVGLTVDMAQRKAGLEHETTLAPGELPVRGTCFDVALESGEGLLIIDAP